MSWGQVSPKETKGSVSLCANIANICFPSQILCNCYSKVFNFVNILKNCTILSVPNPSICLFGLFPCQFTVVLFDYWIFIIDHRK